MKKFAVLLITIVLLLFSITTPLFAASLSISPPVVAFDVFANGSATVEFIVYGFTGNLEISLEDIPLKVEPITIPVKDIGSGTKIVLNFYGDKSLGNQVYNGKIRFLAMTGGSVAMGIKVKATINHIAPPQLLEKTSLPTLTPEVAQPLKETTITPKTNYVGWILLATGLIVVVVVVLIIIVRRKR